MAKREVVIILVVLILALAVWAVLGILFVRHLRRNKPIQDTVGGVPVRWPPSSPTARAARVSDAEKANLPAAPPRARHSTQQSPLGSSSLTAPPSLDLEASVVQASAAVAEGARPHAGISGQTRLEGGLPARHDRQEPVSVPSPLEPRRLPEAPTTDISIPTSSERPPDLPAQPEPTHLPYTGAPPTYEEILRS
ncbi:hypothetical protein FS837_004735 [Tulasnella sp. UAMH 9824]|nr:hypothetical protein FS837_004735 [Tulasnella sp. UAMH 9824]